MKRYISALALISRATFCKIILVIFAMAAIEIGLFYITLGDPDSLATLEEEIDSSRITWICTAAFIAVGFILESFGQSRSNSYPAYTISRLSIKENHFAFLCGIYNTCCFTILISVQILTALILCLLYVDHNTSDPYSPAIFLAFYRNGFLHGLFPLGDTWGMITNVLLLLSLGFTCICSSLMRRQGKHYVLAAIFLCSALVIFPTAFDESGNRYFYFIIAFIILNHSFYRIWKGDAPDEDQEAQLKN